MIDTNKVKNAEIKIVNSKVTGINAKIASNPEGFPEISIGYAMLLLQTCKDTPISNPKIPPNKLNQGTLLGFN